MNNAAPRSWLRDNWDVVLLLALAGAVYRPWDVPHLPLTDFGMFLGARGTGSFLSQYAGVAGYYLEEGRFCLITHLYLVLGSMAFGTWAPGWHWTYFVLNAAALLIARSLLLKIGVGRTATFVALALWAMIGPTAELWIRPAGEQIGLLFFLAAMHYAVNYSDAPDWRARAWKIAACAVALVLSKEILVVMLPAVWLLSRLSVRNGEWSWAGWSNRDAHLLKHVAIGTMVVMVPIAYVAVQASDSSYAAQYSTESARWRLFFQRLEVAAVPSAPRLGGIGRILNDPAWTLTQLLPNLLWIIVIGSAIAGSKRRNILWPLAIAGTWLVAGVLAYLPWPSKGMYYMMPFALGTMFLAAHALHRPLSPGDPNRRVTLALVTLLIVVASIEARSTVYQHRLRATLNARVLETVRRSGRPEVLIAAVPSPLAGRGGWAEHLKGFTSATGGEVPAGFADLACADAKSALESKSGVVVVSAAGGCGKLADNSVVVADAVPRLRWPHIWKPMRSEGRMFVAFGPPARRISDSRIR